MRGEQRQRKPMRRELLQAELDRPVRVAARTPQRHALARQPPDRKVLELLIAFALDDHRAAAALRRLDAEEHRRRPRAARAVDDDIDAALSGDLHHALEW